MDSIDHLQWFSMPSTIRSFIAIKLPQSVIALLANVQEDLQSMGLRAKWLPPENIHLTLKFLGNIAPGDIDNIGGAMIEAVGKFAAFSLAVEGVGVFPGINRPRVIWVGLNGQVQLLFAMQRLLEDNLAALGYEKEKRPFKGHLTIGRFRRKVRPNTIRRIIEKFGDLNSEEFTVTRVILYRSDLKSTGAVYSQLQQAVLE